MGFLSWRLMGVIGDGLLLLVLGSVVTVYLPNLLIFAFISLATFIILHMPVSLRLLAHPLWSLLQEAVHSSVRLVKRSQRSR